MKTKHEIIDIIASSYTSKTRAMTGKNHCQYITEDGRKCAVGMFMTDEGLEFSKGLDLSATGINRRLFNEQRRNLDDILIKEVRGHELLFWDEMQNRLHDKETYWDENGITPKGKSAFETLKNVWL
jgi:hypothetical protein